jgi:hypothetical protein
LKEEASKSITYVCPSASLPGDQSLYDPKNPIFVTANNSVVNESPLKPGYKSIKD